MEPNEPVSPTSPQTQPSPPTQKVVLRAQKLCKRYGEFVAVRDIDVEVQAQECFGFLGPNGAGKTSTMKMVSGACLITSGTLEILGYNAHTDIREIKRRIGVVPQELNLDDELSVLENLLVYARFFDISWRDSKPHALELLDKMQLLEKQNQRVYALSGGMKRRLLIARALVGRPQMLLLDEPTVGLDPQARHLLWGILQQLRQQGITLLLTTHYMDEAERLCDRLVIMHEGSIIAEGSPQSLIETHAGSEVLEVEQESQHDEPLVAAFGSLAMSAERVGQRFLLYGRDGDAMLQRLREHESHHSRVTLRRATLEDVFLKLTGRELRDG